MTTETDRLIRCPAGTFYDPSIHTECPCPHCWADRVSANLDGTQRGVEGKASAPVKRDGDISTEAEPPSSAGIPESESSATSSFFDRNPTARTLALVFSTIAAVAGSGIFFAYNSKPNSAEETLFVAARGDVAKLKQYVASCKVCGHKSDALSEITSLERQARLVKDEEDTYRAARGAPDRLRAYATSCKVCAFAVAAAEEGNYLAARGKLDQLAAYLNTCRTCEFEAAARLEVKNLEYAAKVFVFEVCNRATDPVAIAIAGRRNPDFSDLTVSGWGLVDPGACKPLGKFARGRIYAVAQVKGSRKGWYGNDAKYCVEFPGPFDRVVSANSSCPSSGKVVGFQEFIVTTDKHTWSLDGAPSFSDDEFFSFEVCNRSSDQASVAIAARRVPASSDWTVEGWWQISPGACTKLGRFAKGKLYVVAKVRDDPRGWFGTDTKQCVQFPGPFARNVSSDSGCTPDEKIMGFQGSDVTNDSYTWSISGAPSFSGDDFFSFEVCNKSRKRASVALMGRADPSSEFRVQGWHNVSADTCETIGRFTRGTFYATATLWGDLNRGWWQKDIRLCVAIPGPFNRANPENYRCAGNEKLVPFRKFSVTAGKLGWTLN
jgi:uncharacterized membrane protein